MAEANTLPTDTYDILIFKLDSDGNLVWRNEIDKSNGEEVSYDLHLMPTNVLLSGGYKNYFIDNAYVNKDILVTGLLASGQTSVYPFDGSMVTTWEIPASSLSLKLPLSSEGTYNFTVDWGDGNQSTITSHSDPEARHVYSSAGTYTVQISGTLTHWDGSNYDSGDAEKLVQVNSLGDLGFLNLHEAFKGTSNLSYFSGGVTNNVVNMAGMFSGASKINNLDLSTFDTSSVTDMNSMFEGTHNLQTLDVSMFDTTNVTNMEKMFNCDANSGMTYVVVHDRTYQTLNTNGQGGLITLDISNFDTSNVTNMRKMFSGCSLLTNLTLGSQFITSKSPPCMACSSTLSI